MNYMVVEGGSCSELHRGLSTDVGAPGVWTLGGVNFGRYVLDQAVNGCHVVLGGCVCSCEHIYVEKLRYQVTSHATCGDLIMHHMQSFLFDHILTT